jgi:carbonic anhydrase
VTVRTAAARDHGTDMNAITSLLENNERYARTFAKGGLPGRPATKIAIVTCMDARFDPARALGLEEGDAHVIRNAGGVVTDDVIRSLVISQRLLGTEAVVAIHHTDCGMLTLNEEKFAAELESETGTRPHFALESFSDLEISMRESLARIVRSPFVAEKHSVRGFIYDVETGRLREVT